MKKEKTIVGLIDIELKRMKGAKNAESFNSLDTDAQSLIDETIAALEELRQRAAAEDNDNGVDDIVNQLRDIVDEKINAALEKVKDVAPVTSQNSDYLKSKQAVKDYAAALRNNAKNIDGFKREWGEKLKTNGITFDGSEAFMPELMKSRIEDNWNSDTNWLRRLNNTGAKRFAIRYALEDQDDTNVRAKGHKRNPQDADERLKREQNPTLAAKIIALQAVYKLLPIDRIVEFEDDGQLLEWVADEISRQMYYEIGRAILIGDGRNPATDPDAITSFETINRASGDSFVSVTTITSNPLIEEVMSSVIAPIYDGREIVLFLGKDDLFELRKFVYSSSATPHYASIDELKDMLGVADIVVVPYLSNSGNSGEARIIGMHLDKYYTVGRMEGFEFVSWEDYMNNMKYYRGETFVGGGAGLGCAAVLQHA